MILHHSKTPTISVVVSDYSKRYNLYSINCLFYLKYIEVEFDCYPYSKYIQFQQILKYFVITGSRLYININLKHHKSEKNESSKGGGTGHDDAIFCSEGGLSRDDGR